MSYDMSDFNTDVIERSRKMPVLVDFWAEWCGPCKVLSPVLENLAEKNKDQWDLVKINTEEHPNIAAQYGIRSIPNVKLFINGEVKNEFVGALPESAITQWLGKALPGKYREQIEKAQLLLLDQRINKAQKILGKVAELEPDNQKVAVLLAQTYLYSDHEKVLSLIKNIREDSEYFDAAEAMRTFAKLIEIREQQNTLPESAVKQVYLDAIENLGSGNFGNALEKFIDVIRRDRYYDDDGARRACISIFKLLGEDNEITKKYRQAFSSALYV